MENKTSLAEATLPQIRQMVLENTERINRHELTLNRMLMEQQKQSRETGEQRYSLENSRKEFDRQISDINATLDRVAKMTEEYRADMRELKQQSKESDARIEKFRQESEKRSEEYKQQVFAEMRQHNKETDERIEKFRQESDARIEKFRQESEKRSEEYKQQVFAEMRQHNKETDERIEKFRQESDARIEKFRKESERRTEEYKQQVFAEMRQHNKETDERIEKFRQESDARIEKFRQESDERIEKFRQESDARIEAHRKAIDARIEKDWEKIKKEREEDIRIAKKEREEDRRLANKEREDFKKFKREFYGLTWHITEGLVSSSTEKIFQKAGFNLQNSGKNIKRKLTAENKQMEIDVLLSGENLVVPVEVKTDFTHKDLEHFLKQMRLFRELFPEHDGKEVIAAVASFNYDNGVDALAHEQGLLVIRVSSEEIFSLDPVDRETLRRF